jgi:hypothetical protein
VGIYLFDGDFGGERGGKDWEEVSGEGGRRREEERGGREKRGKGGGTA